MLIRSHITPGRYRRNPHVIDLWEDFGAWGDGSHDDTGALQRALDYMKTRPWLGVTTTSNPNSATAATLRISPGIFKTTDSLWAGADTDEDYDDIAPNIEGTAGSIIKAQTDGKAVFDFVGAYNVRMSNLTIYGDDDTNSPSIGILLGPAGDGGDGAGGANPLSAGTGTFTNVKLYGLYVVAPVYNYASEVNKWANCEFRNKAGLAAFIATSTNDNLNITSEFTTLSQTYASSYGDRFVNCDFRNTGDGTDDECVVLLESTSFGPKYINCYFNPTSEVKPVFRLRAAGGASVTQARTKGVSCLGCVFESGYDCVFWVDHVVSSLYMRACSLSETSPGTADIVVTATGDIRHMEIQPYRGNANTEAVTVSNSGVIGRTKNLGTATVTNGNTSVAVSHGLRSTPALTNISVTPTNNMGSATHYWITNPTSTQFTINVDQDPGGDATFAWQADLDFV